MVTKPKDLYMTLYAITSGRMSIDKKIQELLNLEKSRLERLNKRPTDIIDEHWDIMSPFGQGGYWDLTEEHIQYLTDNAEFLSFLKDLSDRHFANFYNMMTGLHIPIHQVMMGYRAHQFINSDYKFPLGFKDKIRKKWREFTSDENLPYVNALSWRVRSKVNSAIYYSPVIEVMQDENTTLNDIIALKEIAKAFSNIHPNSITPTANYSNAIVLASYCAALERFGERITRMNDAELVSLFNHYLNRPYVPKELKTMITSALGKL